MHIPRIRKRSSLTKCMAAILPLCMAYTAVAQEDEEDVYMMNPFEVNTSEDIGYLSTNSTSGTSLNTALKDLPMAISVINQDFITDLGASDLEEALSYQAGVFTSNNEASTNVGRGDQGGGSGDKSISSAASGAKFANTAYIRGLAVPFQNRMGFRYGGLVVTPDAAVALGGLMDSVNIERMEVVKGPNSLLYGVGVLTGIVNVAPIKPLNEAKYDFSIKVGSYDFFRTTVEATGPLLKDFLLEDGELNYRIAGTYEEKGDWTDYKEKEVEYFAAQLEFKSKPLNVFMEFQQGKTTRKGTGSQWVYDRVNDNYDTEFRNEYDEAYNWARHDGYIYDTDEDGNATNYLRVIEANLDEEGKLSNLPVGDTSSEAYLLLEGEENRFVGGGLDRETRITGPDTYAERDEWNFITDATITPMENLTINLGIFISEQETEELNLVTRNYEYVKEKLYDTSDASGTDPQVQYLADNGMMYGRLMSTNVRNYFGLGNLVDQDPDADYAFPIYTDDIKATEYWWERDMVESLSVQWRARLTYTIETPFLGDTKASHTFLVGTSYINDKVDFSDGSASRTNAGSLQVTGESRSELKGNDALYYRSIADMNVFRLKGDTSLAATTGDDEHKTIRSGDAYMRQDIVQEGYYAVYNGKFFDEKLEVIIGARRDIYNTDESTYKRYDIDRLDLINLAQLDAETQSKTYSSYETGLSGDFYQGLKEQVSLDPSYILTPEDFVDENGDAYTEVSVIIDEDTGETKTVSATSAEQVLEAADYYEAYYDSRTATGEYINAYYRTYVEEALDYHSTNNFGELLGRDTYALDLGTNRSGDTNESFGIVPGSKKQLFEDDVEVDTWTYALNYELTDNITIYGVMSEGISPNTALKDGNGELIEAESTENKEIGIKFDFFDGKLSGSISAFEIERENAIWDIDYAPAASKWYDAATISNRSPDWDTATYRTDTDSYYYINEDYIKEVLNETHGLEDVSDRYSLKRNAQAQVYQYHDELGTRTGKAIEEATVFDSAMIGKSNDQAPFGGSVTLTYWAMPTESANELYDITLYNIETEEYTTVTMSNAAFIQKAFAAREVDKTKNDLLKWTHPVRYRAFDTGAPVMENNNVDLADAQGALVTFDETIEGIETEFIWTPNENWQFVVSYSHIEREADDSFNFTEWESLVDGETGDILPYTMLHREFGLEGAGIEVMYVDQSAYDALKGEDLNVVNINDLSDDQYTASATSISEIDQGNLSSTEIGEMGAEGKFLAYVDKRGNIIDSENPAQANDYDSILNGVSLNFNPEDEVAIWSKYTFTEGLLDNLSLNVGVKYVGESETSVAFNSVSPLNGLSESPVVSDYFKVDFGASYKFEWLNADWKLSLNIYNIADTTYSVEYKTLDTENPITGETITKRTEDYRAPTNYKLGMSVSF